MTKLLFVDDEPTIRLTLPLILEMHEFEVKAVANVSEALALIQSEKFDVLLSDLNIGEPSDGFTVVSAMRRIQPQAVTIIITGYPAFETALEAIRGQVDDYIVKPAATEELVKTIREKLIHRPRHVLAAKRRVSQVIEENTEEIMARYIRKFRKDRCFPSTNFADDEVRNHLPSVLAELVRDLKLRDGMPRMITEAAQEHGHLRCRQGFSHPALVQEICILRNVVYSIIQENLLSVDVSSLIPDMVRISDNLDLRLKEAMEAYITACEATPVRKAAPVRKTARSR
jgi:YesN/AraC family two-component response regulator